MMLFCVLRRHATAADSPLQRPPVAEPRLHPAVSFQRRPDVQRPRWFVAIRARVTVLTGCAQVCRRVEAPHCGEVDH